MSSVFALAAFALLTTACNRSRRTAEATLSSAPIAAAAATRSADQCSPSERPLPNEGLNEPTGLGGCPPGMAPIALAPGRCIDRWEAHLVELTPDGRERSVSPYFNPEGNMVRAKSAPGAVPQAYINRAQAEKACELASKRLCTHEEWLSACRGAEARRYPYGQERRPGTCNDQRDAHPVIDDLASARRGEPTSELMQDPCVNQQPETVGRTGTKVGCVTNEQVYDLVGNVHEWTSDRDGAFRGGFYADTEKNGSGCNYVTSAHGPAYWDYSTGFRCCADRP